MSKTGTVKLHLGPAKTLVGVIDEDRDCPTGETDDWWTVNIFVPVRYEFMGDWEPNEFTRQFDFRTNFERIIHEVWSPEFSLFGEETDYYFSRNTIRCFLEFNVLDVDRSYLNFRIGPGWTSNELMKRGQVITVVEVYPGKQTGAHTIGNRMRIGEDLSLVDKPASELDPHPEKQIDAAHEMGHILGFDHPECNHGASKCYGAAGSPSSADIMGRGMRATSKQEILFTSIMAQMNDNYNWRVWTDIVASVGIPNTSRRDANRYPNSSGKFAGPLGMRRVFT